jgi:flagellar M-ring protein FliF
MNFGNLLKNRAFLLLILGIIVIMVVLMITSGSGEKESSENKIKAEKDKIISQKEIPLISTTDAGKALEIQALLARENIPVRKGGKGSKIELVLSKEDGITNAQRDTAIIHVVKSGLMDNNIGLEIFDKGDFTSSREDKRIRLARAINGELTRLIKMIPAIEDASVFVSIPKDTIFTALQQPTTATVQLVVAPDRDRLDDNIIRTIKNLLLGSVEGLQAENVSITDTNGNVYSSVMSASDDMMKLLEEKDSYMKNKIIAQLDKLLGKGNYVVTVSTYLRETPQESDKIIFRPDESSVGNKQKFTENLGDNSRDKSKLSNAVSSYLPGGMPNPESTSNRNYSRSAEEFNYKVGQTRIAEVKKPGMLEEISIAVTINKGNMPTNMTVEQLKDLIATSASPKAFSKNVSIAFSDQIRPLLAHERPVQLPQPEESGNPWWTVAAVLAGGLLVGLIFIAGRVKDTANKQQDDINSLAEISSKQEKALQEANQRAAQLQNLQQQMYQQLTAVQQQALTQQQRAVTTIQSAAPDVNSSVRELQKSIEEEVDEQQFATTLKSWIESAG